MNSRPDSWHTSTSRRTSWRAGAVAVLIAIIGSLAIPVTVQAHTELSSSSPVDGAVLDVPPDAITFTFNEDLLAGSSSIALNDMTGTTVLSESVDAVGPTITVPWPADLPAGTYQAAYRVVAADGHPVTGAIGFTLVGTSAKASAVPEPSAAARPVVEPPMGVTGSIVILGVVIIALVTIALVAAAMVVVRRGRAR